MAARRGSRLFHTIVVLGAGLALPAVGCATLVEDEAELGGEAGAGGFAGSAGASAGSAGSSTVHSRDLAAPASDDPMNELEVVPTNAMPDHDAGWPPTK